MQLTENPTVSSVVHARLVCIGDVTTVTRLPVPTDGVLWIWIGLR